LKNRSASLVRFLRAGAAVAGDNLGIPQQLHEDAGRVDVAHGYAAKVVLTIDDTGVG